MRVRSAPPQRAAHVRYGRALRARRRRASSPARTRPVSWPCNRCRPPLALAARLADRRRIWRGSVERRFSEAGKQASPSGRTALLRVLASRRGGDRRRHRATTIDVVKHLAHTRQVRADLFRPLHVPRDGEEDAVRSRVSRSFVCTGLYDRRGGSRSYARLTV